MGHVQEYINWFKNNINQYIETRMIYDITGVYRMSASIELLLCLDQVGIDYATARSFVEAAEEATDTEEEGGEG